MRFLRGVVRSAWWLVAAAWWDAVGAVDPRCPDCHRRLVGNRRMTAWGMCVECYSDGLDLAHDYRQDPGSHTAS